jgi:hypothetical protein
MGTQTVRQRARSHRSRLAFFCIALLLTLPIVDACDESSQVHVGESARPAATHMAVASPTKGNEIVASRTQPPRTDPAIDTPSVEHDITAKTPFAQPSLPTSTPERTTAAGTFVKCFDEMTAGSSARVNINCWEGVISGHPVFVRAGYERHWYERDGSCGSEEEGFYSMYATMFVVATGVHQINYSGPNYLGCGQLRILSVSNSAVTFQLDYADTFAIDFARLLQEPTPSH